MITIDPANVSRVYSGKSGCMCGCLGKYYEHDDAPRSPAFMRIINKVTKDPNVKFDEDARCYYVDHNGRNNVVYLK